jgi:hypothetical protein
VNLHWRPVKGGKEVGGGAIRELLMDRKRFWDASDVPYLQGLRDGGVDGAAELIEAIKKHQEIELYVQ